MTTFGGPGGQQKHFAPNPPQRGSFPLDHDGQCKAAMTAYLGCMSSARGANARCREDARAYLECRMARNLMARDEMRNLGFWDEDGGKAGAAAAVEGGAAAAAREGGGRVDVAEGKDPTEPKSRGADAAGKGK